MYLNDAKVVKYFGIHPELGRPIASTLVKRVTVGVRWSLPRKCYEPDDDVLVRPCVALICKGKGKWDVKYDSQYTKEVHNFLTDHCK